MQKQYHGHPELMQCVLPQHLHAYIDIHTQIIIQILRLRMWERMWLQDLTCIAMSENDVPRYILQMAPELLHKTVTLKVLHFCTMYTHVAELVL